MGAYPFLLCLLLTQALNITPLTKDNLIVGDLALSADGTRLAYSIPGPKGRTMDFWIRDVATLRGEKIVPPEQFGHSIVFAPDGKSLYFTVPDQVQPWVNHLFHWPIAGGEAKRIATHVDGPVSFSPNGVDFAFLRNLGHMQNALIVRSAATGAERTLARTDIGGGLAFTPAWSPDGREIVCANRRELLFISTQTGDIRRVAAPGIVWALAWPSHGGLFAIIDENISRLDVARGSWEAISNKPDRFAASRICVTPDGAILAAIRYEDVMPATTWFVGFFGLSPLKIYYSNIVLIHLAR